ncbi:MAG: glycosyltransferase family 39 protein [Methanobrevibacter sp.]|jgi:hypothetical protein|nr:glycosyltransferase family 39 protein [Candidatus Methanovirga aequatorialis]
MMINRYIKQLTDKRIGYIFMSCALILILINLIFHYFSYYVRYDEIYTLTLIKDTVPNIIHQCSLDVHPPLHYLIVKAFVSTGHLLHLPLTDKFLGDISSTVPYLLLLVFSYKFLCKDIGVLGAGLFSFCMISMPQMLLYATDVRMYSWGMLFAVLSFYTAYKITLNNNKIYYFFIGFFTVLSLYTQYYVGITVFSIYLLLFGYLSLYNNWIKIKRIILTGIISFGTFGFWIPSLISQVKYVSSSFWIAETTTDILYNFVLYFLSATKLGDTTSTVVYSPIGLDSLFLSILIIVLGYISIKYLLDQGDVNSVIDKLKETNFLTFGFCIIFLVIILSFYASNIINKPILHVRYLVISIPLFWLSVSILISRLYKSNKQIFSVCLILLLIGGSISTYYSFNTSYIQGVEVNSMTDALI